MNDYNKNLCEMRGNITKIINYDLTHTHINYCQ